MSEKSAFPNVAMPDKNDDQGVDRFDKILAYHSMSDEEKRKYGENLLKRSSRQAILKKSKGKGQSMQEVQD